MISIKNDIESVLDSLENNLEKTNPILLGNIKDLIYQTVIKNYTEQFKTRQRRINAIKSPFKKVRELLHEIIGENIESEKSEEIIDTTILETEKEITKDILNNLSYHDCINYLKYSNKHGLKKANNFWRTQKPLTLVEN